MCYTAKLLHGIIWQPPVTVTDNLLSSDQIYTILQTHPPIIKATPCVINTNTPSHDKGNPMRDKYKHTLP